MILLFALWIYLAAHIGIGEATTTPCAQECTIEGAR